MKNPVTKINTTRTHIITIEIGFMLMVNGTVKNYIHCQLIGTAPELPRPPGSHGDRQFWD